MPTFPDHSGFAFSFSHAVVKVGDRQFTGVDGVRINQDVQDSPVYGTSRMPIKRSAGQVQMGAGNLSFSDYEEGTDFFRHLSPDPYMRLWTLDYSLVLETGTVRSVECISCRLLGIGIDHASGPDAVGVQYPFSFLSLKVDGIDTILSPKGILSAALGIAQNLVNLL